LMPNSRSKCSSVISPSGANVGIEVRRMTR
jgi:hypothetical protein